MSALAVEQIQLIDLKDLKVHPANPRKDVGDITELAQSIKSAGLIEPIVAVKKNGHFEVVAGSRRLAAAKFAKITSLPVRVMELDEAQARAAALIENMQRKDLNPLEEAEAFSEYIALTGCTRKVLGEKVGRAESTISNALRLLKAPKATRDALASGFITANHVRVLLQLKDDSLMAKVNLVDRFRRRGEKDHAVTVDQLENDVHQLNEQWDKAGPPAVARLKAKLEEQQKNQKGFTITWREDPDRYGDRVDLVKALGAPPAKVHAEFYGSPAKHDKLCTCRAFELEQGYEGEAKVTRVCIDAKGAAALTKANEGHRPYTPSRGADYGRPTTKAGKAAYVRKRVDSHLGVSGTAGWGRRKPADVVYKKLAAGGLTSEKGARLVAYALIVDRCIKAGAEQLELWKRIQKMSASKVRTLILEHAAAIVNGEVLDSKDGGARLAARVEVMRGFGVPVGPKIAEQADEFIRKLAPSAKATKR